MDWHCNPIRRGTAKVRHFAAKYRIRGHSAHYPLTPPTEALDCVPAQLGDAKTNIREVGMKRNLLYALFAAVLLGTALHYAVNAGATPANGFTATTLAKGTLGSFEVFNHFVPPIVSEESEEDDKKICLSWQKTKGESDLYVQSNVWASGSSTGWHSHPGHCLVIVTAGTLTVKIRGRLLVLGCQKSIERFTRPL